MTDRTTVFGYVLGDRIDPTETGERKEGDRTIIRPMLYSSFIGQAEKRMLNLHRRLTDAPFMKAALAQFVDADNTTLPTQPSLLEQPIDTKISEIEEGAAVIANATA